MMIRFRKALRRFRREEEGVTLVEYGIAVTLAVVVGTVLLAGLGGAINGQLVDASTCMTTPTADPVTGVVTGVTC